jgi:hypothetical protein
MTEFVRLVKFEPPTSGLNVARSGKREWDAAKVPIVLNDWHCRIALLRLLNKKIHTPTLNIK